MGPCLSLDLSPDCEFLEPTSGACSGASSDWAEDPSSLGDMVFESAASERSSRDDRSDEELLEVVTVDTL